MRIGLFVSWIVERRDVIEAEMDSFLTVPRRERRRVVDFRREPGRRLSRMYFFRTKSTVSSWSAA